MKSKKIIKKIDELRGRAKNSPFFWQSMANYTERAMGIAYSMVLARLILPEVFGIFAYGTGIAVLATILTRWEVGNLVRADSYYQNEGFASAWALTRLLVVAEIGVIVSATALCWFLGLNYQICIVVFVIGFFTALGKFSVLLRCDLEGKSQFRSNLTLKLLLAPLVMAVTIPMALADFGIWALLASSWIGVVLNWFIYRRANPRKIHSAPINKEMIKKIVRPSFWIWINYMCLTIFNRADKVLLGNTQSNEQIGYYNRAYNYAPLSFMVFGALASSPAIVAFRNIKNKQGRIRAYLKRLSLLTCSGLVGALVWLVWADELVPLLFGKNWIAAIPHFKYFAFLGLVQGLYFLTSALLQGSGLFKVSALIKLLSIIIGIILIIQTSITILSVAIILQGVMLLSAIGMLVYFLAKPGKLYSD